MDEKKCKAYYHFYRTAHSEHDWHDWGTGLGDFHCPGRPALDKPPPRPDPVDVAGLLRQLEEL